MAVRQYAARVGAGDNRHSRIRQFFYRISATERSATQPQQRPSGLFKLRPQRVDHCRINRGKPTSVSPER